ncbi:hypothetical protein F2Q70_00036829 [Brassica cretica]|uniref:Uncharacterized protein n=1 Tax=Brassica cretica TaxID=69181 RepID=A0A8S9JQQ4_BRACR|nr:hypothetical protein F2Q68_00032154 [Brassica cretica]KAF2583827.1 hypothetical protein F2Q70_00036829 [Brassica cretica]
MAGARPHSITSSPGVATRHFKPSCQNAKDVSSLCGFCTHGRSFAALLSSSQG